MIYRGNWQIVQAYLKYRSEVDQLSDSSSRLEETWLRHLLEWAKNIPFEQAPRIRPTLPEYMLTARMDDEKKQLSPIYIKKIIATSKRFFEWVIKHRRGFSSKITAAWIDTLKPPRLENETKEHEAVTLDEIKAIAAAPVSNMRDRRIQAAAVLWFLSGIRIGAFVTLPIKAVNLNNRTILQFPSLGVHTKFTKKATTYILGIPELLPVVQAWDIEVRKHLPDNSFWYAPLSPESGYFDNNIIEAGAWRASGATKDLKDFLYRVGLPYHSPHKFRHGHAVYALQQSKDVADLKAVSMNLMHSNLSVTDGVYGILSSADVGKRIAGLGKTVANGQISQDDLANELIALAEKLKQSS